MASAASGNSSYCSPGQFLFHYDVRSVCELLSDTGTPVSQDDVEADEKLTAILAEASGEVESAACLGQRYVIDETRNDLAALTGNSAAFLAGMVAHLAMYSLWCRRPAMMMNVEPPPLFKKAEKFLEQLRLGERVFGILEAHKAAKLEAGADTAADVEARNGLVVEAGRLFGTRVNRSRPS